MSHKINRRILIICIILLIQILIPSTSPAIHPAPTASFIFVDDDNTDGPWDGTEEHPYQYINDALHAAQHNDIIYIKEGVYPEQLTVNKTLTLLGEQRHTTIIDGDYQHYAVHIKANNVKIENITIQNTTGSQPNAALRSDANHTTIKHTTIRNTNTGFSITRASSQLITNSSIHDNRIGIHLIEVQNTIINGCILAHNAHALLLEGSHDIQLSYSYFHTNGRSAVLTTSYNIDITHCNISDNSVNLGGLLLESSTKTRIIDNIICHNGQGITLNNAHQITIEQNQLCKNTHFALWINYQSTQITIQENNIQQSYRYALYLLKSSECQLIQNNIEESCLYAIYNQNAYCDARNNYWGTPRGPSFTDLRQGRRISLLLGRTRWIPWETQPIKTAGPTWQHNEHYMEQPTTYPFTKHIELPGSDLDQDHAPDWWEQKWNYPINEWNNHTFLDPDNDGLTNIEECYTDHYGSNPFHKDIFIEIDWMQNPHSNTPNKPNTELINQTKNTFAQHNITLHIDIGNLDGGEQLPYETNFTFIHLNELYWHYFLNQDINNPRKGIFHYGILCDYGPDVNYPYMGMNHLDSFLISVEWIQHKVPNVAREKIIIGGIIHHLGHHLHLLADTYDGIDNTGTLLPLSIQWFKYRNYKSTMNYRYKYEIISYSDGTHGRGDFNDWNNLDLSFFKNTTFKIPSINKAT